MVVEVDLLHFQREEIKWMLALQKKTDGCIHSIVFFVYFEFLHPNKYLCCFTSYVVLSGPKVLGVITFGTFVTFGSFKTFLFFNLSKFFEFSEFLQLSKLSEFWSFRKFLKFRKFHNQHLSKYTPFGKYIFKLKYFCSTQKRWRFTLFCFQIPDAFSPFYY